MQQARGPISSVYFGREEGGADTEGKCARATSPKSASGPRRSWTSFLKRSKTRLDRQPRREEVGKESRKLRRAPEERWRRRGGKIEIKGCETSLLGFRKA